MVVQAQTIVYVSPNGSGDGTSWANASSIELAVATAAYNSELRLRGGTYPITTTLSVTQQLTINGGYTGIGTNRNITTNPSVLNGGGNTQIMEIDASGVVMDGLTFLAGFAASGADVNDGTGGGAIYISSNGVTITNSIFRNNVSAHRIGSGAIYLWSCDDIQIADCLFENNSVVENVSTVGNMGGGAIHIRFGKNTRIVNTVFRNNDSRYTGGAIHDWGENTQFENCIFEDNRSDENGGGLFIRADFTLVNNCRFERNQAVDGGGVYLSNDNSHFSNSIFRNNKASNNGGGLASNFGGFEMIASNFEGNSGRQKGGAIYNHRFAVSSLIERTTFNENDADQGGAIYNYSEEGLKVISSLFVANRATDKGGAIFNNRFMEITNATLVKNTNTALIMSESEQSEYNPCVTNIFNAIFYLNTAKAGGYRADIHSENLNRDLSTQDVRRNILQEYIGTNNQVGVNPIFVNNTNDFRLQAASPAIDAGRVSLFNGVSDTNAGSSTDLDGNGRNQGVNIDMGAYETDPSTIVIPACVSIIAPEDGAEDISLDAEITWSAVGEAAGYHITIGTTSGGTDIVDNEEVTGTTYTPTIDWEENTTYYVTVVPYNAAGEAEGCPEISFTTTTLLAAPECVTITSPADDANDVGLGAGITWTAADDADGYRISIGTTSGGIDIVNGQGVTGTTYTPATDWEENTTYYVTVIPYNAAGEAEGCAEISFTTTTLLAAPECATITSPADDANDVGLGAGITWTAAEGADGYHISIGTTSGGTDIVNGQEVTGTTYTPATDWEENTTYYVTVIPYNAAGEAEGCPEISFTTTTLLAAPECVTITSPADDANDVGLGAGITWTAADDADGYRISIGTTSGGTDIINSVELTGTTYTPATDWEENTTYYVTVIPYNAAGEAEGCAEISFTTTTLLVASECTAVTSPADDATDVGLGAGITWTAADDADGYRISIGTTSGGTDIINSVELTGTTYTPATDWEEGTTYYVTVIPYNAAGEAAGCAEISFTTTTLLVAPECTTITSPADDATDVGLGAGITWAPADDADGYHISIGTTSGGTDIINSVELTGTTYTPATDWEENTTYYVTVIPYNAAGEAEGCAEISFTTAILPRAPECTIVTSPVDGASNDSLDVEITWIPIEGAEGYRIIIGTTPGGMDVIDSTIVTGAVFNPMFDFAENTTYYLSVIPFNVAGEATGCSQTRFIFIPSDNQTDKPINRTKYGFSPNGDGINDFWKIDGIERYPDNTVFIYNRWGDRVFEMKRYDNHSRVFNGVANRSTRLGAGVLPAGTYFFTIQYRDSLETKKIEGFLVLKR